MPKCVPLASNSGLEDRFLTYLVVMLSGADVTGPEVVVVCGGVVAMGLLEAESVLEVLGLGFEQLP